MIRQKKSVSDETTWKRRAAKIVKCHKWPQDTNASDQQQEKQRAQQEHELQLKQQLPQQEEEQREQQGQLLCSGIWCQPQQKWKVENVRKMNISSSRVVFMALLLLHLIKSIESFERSSHASPPSSQENAIVT